MSKDEVPADATLNPIPMITPTLQPPASFAPPPFLPPIPPPWTEHRAPAGQLYWFNPITNVSTYVRPMPPPPPPPLHALPPHASGSSTSMLPPGPGAPGLLAPLHFPSTTTPIAIPSLIDTTKKEKKEKPKIKKEIEGTDWIEVTTNKGNIFWSNKLTKLSVWSLPDEIKVMNEEKSRIEREEKEEKQKEERLLSLKKEEEEEEGKAKQVAESNGQKRKVESLDEVNGKQVKELQAEAPATATPTTTTKVSTSEPTSVIVAESTADDSPPKKKKKTKVVVVHDIEEMEQDEDWQRQIAEEMAQEVEQAQQQQQQSSSEVHHVDEVGRNVSRHPPTVAPLGGLAVSSEEAAALFKAMLGEKEINPMAPWDMELPKFINDSRYTAVKLLKDRRDLFEEFCKEKIREARAAKAKAAAEGSLPKSDPLTLYRELLQTAVASTRTHYSDFKRQHHKDPRFRNFAKTEGEKEKVFKTWLRELGEKKRAEAMQAEAAFREMLSGDAEGIKVDDRWSEVKGRFAMDSRYLGVPSSSQREGLFEAYRKALTAGASNLNGSVASSSTATPSTKTTLTKEERAARAAASLKEREDAVRAEKEKTARQTRAAKGNLGREEGEREFGTLLVDQVRDHTIKWDDALRFLSNDPRFKESSLSSHDQRRLFEAHLNALYEKRLSAVEELFAQNASTLTTRFETVLPSLVDSPHVARLVGKDYDRLEDLYQSWARKWSDRARREFDQLLKESAILEHWGRLAKHEDKEKVNVMGEEGNDESDEEDEMPSIVEMAKQIDLPAIQKVLRHDKRYLVFDHVPAKRDEWVQEYLNNLAAPKQTVHQKE